jgi:hypothetical protein
LLAGADERLAEVIEAAARLGLSPRMAVTLEGDDKGKLGLEANNSMARSLRRPDQPVLPLAQTRSPWRAAEMAY